MAEHERLRQQPPLCPKCGQQARELMPLINCKNRDRLARASRKPLVSSPSLRAAGVSETTGEESHATRCVG